MTRFLTQFAQTDGLSGASKAEDFQPLTRNPQQAPGSLQPGLGSQSAGGQELLTTNPSAELKVMTTGNPNPVTNTNTNGNGINYLPFVIIVSAIIVAAVEYYFSRREKGFKKVPAVASAETSAEQIAQPETSVPVADETPQAPSAPTPKKKKTKSKSKSKRKHK